MNPVLTIQALQSVRWKHRRHAGKRAAGVLRRRHV